MVEFNPKASAEIVYLGVERQPVVVIDNAVTDPAGLVDEAAVCAYQPIGPHYPGIRAAAPAHYFNALFAAIGPLLAQVFDIRDNVGVAESYFSIVTTRPEELQPIQRLPHFDSVDPNRIAALHFLSNPVQGGTSFYRHQSTGFEWIGAERFPAYQSSLQKEVGARGLPPARYIDDGAPLFERTATFEGRFNRLLIYRGINLHCAAIDEYVTYSVDPRLGRLTVNTFLAAAGPFS